MGGEACPWKTGCKFYPDTGRHYFNNFGYHCDDQGRHYLAISSAKGVLDRGDSDLVSWRLSMARDLFGATKEEQEGPTWPKRGDPKVGKRDTPGWAYWEPKVKTRLPKQWLDKRFRDAHFICDQISSCSAMAGTYLHWYMASRLWADAGFPEQFDPGPPPPQPPAFDADETLVDYAATIPARKRQVDRFIKLFRPQMLTMEQKRFSSALGIAGSFDSVLMFPQGTVNYSCFHVRGVNRKPWLDLDLAPGLVQPFTSEEVVLVDWKTSKQVRAETAVQLGLYYLLIREAEGQMEATTGMTLPLPVRLMTVRFFSPQALELRDPANRPRWEVVEVPLELGVELATEALEEARKMGAILL